MLKFMRGKGQQPSVERQKIQRELFAFNKTVHHGFPHKPTALAWDPELKLLALASSSGALKVYGAPGVEYYGQHHAEGGVLKIMFLPNQGRLVTLCEDNSLHLWEVTDTGLEEVKNQVFEGKLKRISAMCLERNGELLLLGTEGGNVYFLNLKTFQMLDSIVYLDIVMQGVPSSYKITNPGAVEAIAQQPESSDVFLIGYTRGLIVLWDGSKPGAVKTYMNTQQLESLCWDRAGKKFASSHNDGSYAFWDVETEEKPSEEPTTLYGPFPCKPVTKLIWRQTEQKELLIFSGGMPRASYSDKYTVTVHGKTHAVLDFTSKVIDFLYMEDPDGDPDAGILVVLTDEEITAVDLNNEEMKMIAMPYLASLHASAVTCSVNAVGVSDALFQTVKEAGLQQMRDIYSEREWPTLGGELLDPPVIGKPVMHELLLTGHEDGTVRFWECSGVALTPIYKFSSAPLFANEEPASPIDDEEEWPPFKKMGIFDPYSDDPRLAIKKVWLCPETGTLVAAGTAGHVIVLRLSDTTRETPVEVTKVNVVSDRDNFIWKGHDPLTAVESVLKAEQTAGLQLTSIVQLYPPAAISAVACSPALGLLALGTAHGLALVDYLANKAVVTKCTLNPNDISGAGDAPISRRKSFKKSLRESFRRLRKGRSTARGRNTTANAAATDARPVERAIEARPQDDGLGSVVRCLHIASTFLVSLQTPTPTFWAGTNNGTVYAFTINMPAAGKRMSAPVTSQLGKEIQLKHRAPVLQIAVVDGAGCPITNASPPLHRVLIVSEEQIKIFSLPSLKPLGKLKVTAHEGCLLRKCAFARFSSLDGRLSDTCLMCLTNFGDIVILSVPDLKRQLNAAVIPREDINGITSLTFTQLGEAFYLHSSSEFQRISLAAAKVTKARCKLVLPESARPKLENGVDGDSDSTSSSSSSSSSSDSSDSGKEDAPMVNGSATAAQDERHDVSIGDITVDSVKDHLVNSSRNSNHSVTETTSTVEESKTTVVKTVITSGTTVVTPPKLTVELTPNLTSTPAHSQTSIDGSAPLAEVEEVEN